MSAHRNANEIITGHVDDGQANGELLRTPVLT